MAVENGALYIADLNANFPNETDFISEGDDHIRLVKQVLKNTFPNATAPIVTNSETMSGIASHLKFESTGSSAKTIDVRGNTSISSRITGGAEAVEDFDYPILSQVRNMMTTAMQKVFPIGSYWITESNDNPNNIFGFGVWEKVTGMIMGSGTVFPDNTNVPNQVSRIFNVGETGGHVSQTIRESNIPRITMDMSTARTAVDGDHRHSIPISSQVVQPNANTNINTILPGGVTYTDTGGAHSHALTGSISGGHDDVSRLPIDIMPPYRVANIWRRRS